jgi:hypothetical protein
MSESVGDSSLEVVHRERKSLETGHSIPVGRNGATDLIVEYIQSLEIRKGKERGVENTRE